MKIGVLGKGKTGGKVIELAGDGVVVFDRTHPLTVEEARVLDGLICFTPGEVFLEHIEVLIESKILVVSGATGCALPQDLDQRLKNAELSWVWASNFSLGMAVVRLMIEQMKTARQLFPNINASIHEVHHTKKLDAPSGTALSWKEWFEGDVTITSERTGDVIGLHTLTVNTPSEKISLEHEAQDRRLFAEGALWALNQLHSMPPNQRPYGLIDFHALVRQALTLTT
jgi:4-hydroxy-tetrahydrodipicolinate reductase